MQVTRDLIVSVNGPGWNYPLARLLVADDGTASLWVPPGDQPVQMFRVEAGSVNAVNGTGTTESGERVTFRRRGSGCSWQLAKCRVATATLAARWTS